MQQRAHNGSQGGETCPADPPGSEDWQNGDAVISRLDADGFHYLHGGHAPGFRPAMVTAGKWEEIKSRLGYRYHIKQVVYPASAAAGTSITLSADIENSGFAKIPYDRTAYFVLRGPVNYVIGATNPKTGTYTRIAPSSQLNQSVRSWTDGAITTFSQTFHAPSVTGNYSVSLYIPDSDCVDNAFCDETTKKNYEVKLASRRGGQALHDPVNGANGLGVSIAVTSGGPACANGGNLLQNCDFGSGANGWLCGVNTAAAATCSVVNGEHVTTITNPGTATYHVQPNQQNLSLVGGTIYTVSFDARASVANRPITVSVSMNHSPYSSHSGVRNFTLGTTLSNHAFSFVMPQSDSNAKLEFGLGANGSNTVVLDNIVLKP